MLLYWIPTENRYVRTQGEAKKLGFGDATDVPTTDKDKFLEWINDLRRELAAEKREADGDTGYVDDMVPQPDRVAMDSGAIDAPIVNKENASKLFDQMAAPLYMAPDERDAHMSALVNSLSWEQAQDIERQYPGILKAVGYTRPKPPMDASAVIARMDNPGGKIDDVIEFIAKMRGGHALKRVAGAVAMRFEELSK